VGGPAGGGTPSRRGELVRLRELAVAVVEQYHLGPADLRFVQHEENTTFLVRAAGDRYVLRIHRPPLRTAPVVESEVRWLAALGEETDLTVPQPVPSADGRWLVRADTPGVPDGRICVLFRWLPGRFIDRGLTPEHLHQAGALAAALQRHGREWRLPADFRRPRQGLITEPTRAAEAAGVSVAVARREPTVFDDHDRARTELTELFGRDAVAPVAELLDRVVEHRERLGTGPEVYGLQHGDLHQENYLFDRRRIRVIDFDDCGFGWHIDDLAVTASEVQGRPNTPELVAALLDGYGRPIENAALDLHVAFRYLQIAAWMTSLRQRFPHWRENVTGLLGAIDKRLD
jgi:Ser/Thr protein kinase RdoA (MazF antagonist)